MRKKKLQEQKMNDLNGFSRRQLIDLLTSIEEMYHSKNERLKITTGKLTRARITIQNQQQKIQNMRQRIIELTPKTFYFVDRD